MDWSTFVSQILMPVLAIIIGVAAPILAAKYVNTQENQTRMLEIDKVAEGILNLIILNNPDMDILKNIDKIKDQLVTNILASAHGTSNKSVAERAAATAMAAKFVTKGAI